MHSTISPLADKLRLMKRTGKKHGAVEHLGPGLAANMRALRKAKGWSQGELAERIGAHLTHVSRVETGKYVPALDFVVKAARAFGVSVDALLSEPETALQEVRIEDKDLADRLKLLEGLDANEREALITVIDSMLTKHRMRKVLEEKPNAAAA